MNIFYLDRNPQVSAEYHCDKHVVKMCVEYTQILTTALYLNGVPKEKLEYKPTYMTRECVIWASKSFTHWMDLWYLGHHLGNEYTKRYKKIHKSTRVLRALPIPHIKEILWEDPPLVMPDEYKLGGVVESYRNFYILDKSRFAKWNFSKKPFWMI